jgi:hypothetical protein
MSPRWLDKRTGDHLALDTGGGAIARLWSTALAGLVDIGYIKATGNSVKIYLPKTALKPEVEFEWNVPQWSNTTERDRARTYFQAYSAAAALYFLELTCWCHGSTMDAPSIFQCLAATISPTLVDQKSAALDVWRNFPGQLCRPCG